MSGSLEHFFTRVEGLSNFPLQDLRCYLSNIVRQTSISERVRFPQSMIDDCDDPIMAQAGGDMITIWMGQLGELMGRSWYLFLANGLSHLYRCCGWGDIGSHDF